MHVQIINSSWPVDSSDLLGFVVAGLKQTNEGLPIVYADAYATEGLLGILEVRAVRGEREILVMDCSRDQVQAVLEWTSCKDEAEFKNSVIILVRKAGS